ncbi:hypothetical protein T01_7377 [Trichinella spiralis]|uniref:Uncharacterized protein n=1 Tax=Trichinella spiralis TaxID=6334 RepID=A0A0V0Z749_TRISP|nr:hypothetical protein T01_7377 [Trichinella spiralis]
MLGSTIVRGGDDDPVVVDTYLDSSWDNWGLRLGEAVVRRPPIQGRCRLPQDHHRPLAR